MKVNLGPYITWWGPYQIAGLLQKVGVSEDHCHDIGKWLSDTWVNDLCEWVHSKRKRTEVVEIDNYDTWNCDSTLAIIIVPLLTKFSEKLHGTPGNNMELDVPEELHAKDWVPENDWDTNPRREEQWNWILKEIIWTMTEIRDGEPNSPDIIKGENGVAAYKAYRERVANGCLLLGKYFQNLWD